MAGSFNGKGSCLCGKVSFTAKNMGQSVGACHCGMCRKWGGGPLMAVDCGTDVIFEGTENISVYNSSEWAERGYCNKCGSHLFYRLKAGKQHMMAAGLFDDNSMFELDHQVFIDEKPTYYCFSNKTNNLTGEEVFARYAPPAE
ncbi:Gfa-like protein [hydrothermal vent metagenome]|uniref:Gfa-like protein n=1 Tax=hydrothermal vent metagenome TaxID=652676 RepID=A0A3B0Y3R6_9ZZZZ